MALVWIPPQMRDLAAGCESVGVPGANVAQVLESLERQCPGMRDRLCPGGTMRSGLAIVVDGQVARLGLLEPTRPDSEVHFLPAIAGG